MKEISLLFSSVARWATDCWNPNSFLRLWMRWQKLARASAYPAVLTTSLPTIISRSAAQDFSLALKKLLKHKTT